MIIGITIFLVVAYLFLSIARTTSKISDNLFFQSIWWTKEPWRWWMRYRTTSRQVTLMGCYNDDCGHVTSSGCICNNYNEVKNKLKTDGFQLVVMCEAGSIWWDGKELVGAGEIRGR